MARTTDLLTRLLGPAVDELGCDECFEQLDRFVELDVSGRAADAAVPGMRAHLDGCRACHEDHDSLVALLDAESWPPRRVGCSAVGSTASTASRTGPRR